MTGVPVKNFNLPLHQSNQYWLSFFAPEGDVPLAVAGVLKAAGAKLQADGYVLRTGKAWQQGWNGVYTQLKQAGALVAVEVGISPLDAPPATRQDVSLKSCEAMQAMADSMWLGDALLENRVMCYLQSVHSSKERVFGYESFARVRMPDGKIIGGLQIMTAAKALGIEHMIDRHLQVEAIRTFAASAFHGFLFVNFFPGFIHRPAVYLEGLGDTAKQAGIVSKHIVLDLTNAEKPRDMAHIKSVCEYGRSRGYSVALDDVASVEVAQRMIHEVRPDFVKIDMHLVRDVAMPATRDTIAMIVQLVHGAGGTVIAEGVETDAIFDALKVLGVDLYQGYLFAAPEPVEMAMKRGVASA